MTISDKNNEISILFEKALEGSLTEKQCQELDVLIVKHPSVCRYYCEYINLNIGIKRITSDATVEDMLDSDAPNISETVSKSSRRRIKKLHFILAFNAAAVLLLFVILNITFLFRNNNVAVLADSLNSVWTENSSIIKVGKAYKSGDKATLLEGFAEIIFASNAEALIEAPAEFQIIDKNKLYLNYGKLFSIVPKEATGFTVSTNSSEIIDIGTKFGVFAEETGNTELHVFKGKTRLVVNSETFVYDEEIPERVAKSVAADFSVSDIDIKDDFFVRDINSDVNYVLKTGKLIQLADILGGGNGSGTGTFDIGIDPVNAVQAEMLLETRESANTYKSIEFNQYIDGVFIPNGDSNQIVSSEGDIFKECPITFGKCFNNILFSYRYVRLTNHRPSNPVPNKCILMHANIGITYDLKAIRETNLGVSIVRFRSGIAIEDNATRLSASNADFWVLIDGEVRYSKRNVKVYELDSFSIDLNEDDRFLTLVTTDGGDPESRIYQGLTISPIDSDWCMFVDPVLVAE